MNAKQSMLVKTYKRPTDFQKDAKKMARHGYTVMSTTNGAPRAGLAHGVASVIFPPLPEVTVTYALVGSAEAWNAQRFRSYEARNIRCLECYNEVPSDASFCPTCGLKQDNRPR